MCQTKMDQKRVKTSHPTGVLRIHGQLKPLERERKNANMSFLGYCYAEIMHMRSLKMLRVVVRRCCSLKLF